MEEKEVILKRKKEVLKVKKLSDNCKIISQGCKNLVIKDGCFKEIQIIGDFETIKFLNNRGTIVDSCFSSKKIYVKSKNGVIKFKDTIIKKIEVFTLIGGSIEYENPSEDLCISKKLYIKKGTLSVYTSHLICSLVVLKDYN